MNNDTTQDESPPHKGYEIFVNTRKKLSLRLLLGFGLLGSAGFMLGGVRGLRSWRSW